MKKGRVLIAAPVHSILTEGLIQEGYGIIEEKKITQNTAFDLIKDCVGVITSTRLQLDKKLIDAAPQLKWIGRMGSGMEVIDVQYATAQGITCYSSPEGNSNAVAEHAMGMLLSLTKRIAYSNEEIKQEKWLREENRGIELEGKAIGIIGFGHTGRAFARKLAGFDMRILVYDKYKQEGIPETMINCKDLEPIFNEAEIISFHVPLQQDTVHYFNKDFIGRMKNKFILINTSRGVVVDTCALHQGFQEGKILGACLDVIEEEPLANMSEPIKLIIKTIIELPEFIITPHIAGYSYEALYKMSKVLLKKIVINE